MIQSEERLCAQISFSDFRQEVEETKEELIGQQDTYKPFDPLCRKTISSLQEEETLPTSITTTSHQDSTLYEPNDSLGSGMEEKVTNLLSRWKPKNGEVVDWLCKLIFPQLYLRILCNHDESCSCIHSQDNELMKNKATIVYVVFFYHPSNGNTLFAGLFYGKLVYYNTDSWVKVVSINDLEQYQFVWKKRLDTTSKTVEELYSTLSTCICDWHCSTNESCDSIRFVEFFLKCMYRTEEEVSKEIREKFNSFPSQQENMSSESLEEMLNQPFPSFFSPPHSLELAKREFLNNASPFVLNMLPTFQ